MNLLGNLFGGALGIVWMLAGPVTYIVAVVDTWHGHSSVFLKLVLNLTVDAILAAIWPATWLIWIVQYAWGSHTTPLSTVLGF